MTDLLLGGGEEWGGGGGGGVPTDIFQSLIVRLPQVRLDASSRRFR